MSAKKEEPRRRVVEEGAEEFGTEMYLESARALREVGTRVVLSVGAAILIWIFGNLIFLPIAKGWLNSSWVIQFTQLSASSSWSLWQL